MIRQGIGLAALIALIGCGNPYNAESTDDGSGNGADEQQSNIPESLARDVSKMIYNASAQTLTVEGLTLDEVPFSAVYTRKPGMDVPGYEAYTVQDDPLDRHATAYVAESNNSGSVRAGVVATGGPRNRVFMGGYYERDGRYRPPAVTNNSGLVSYAGRYVGLTNISGDGGDVLPVPPGTPPELIPDDAAEVIGNAYISADFADNTVEGNIIDRVLVDYGLALPSVVLIATSITEDGTFFGDVEFEGVIGNDIGDYGGIFGGPESDGVAGLVYLSDIDNGAHGLLNDIEYGAFVLDQCGQPVDALICDNVNP